MPTVTLTGRPRLFKAGLRFERNVPRMVPFDKVGSFEDNDLFRVSYSRTEKMALQASVSENEARENGEDPAELEQRDRAEKKRQIRAAVSRLDDDNPEHFTRDGRPDARALSGIVGFTVTAALRDEAMKEADPEEQLDDVLDPEDDDPIEQPLTPNPETEGEETTIQTPEDNPEGRENGDGNQGDLSERGDITGNDLPASQDDASRTKPKGKVILSVKGSPDAKPEDTSTRGAVDV